MEPMEDVEEAVVLAEVNQKEHALHIREASASVETTADSATQSKERSLLTEPPPRRVLVLATLSREASVTVETPADSTTAMEVRMVK